MACLDARASAPQPVQWTPIAPATTDLFNVFADAAGVWRCTDASCAHHAWSGGAVRTRTLPCAIRTFGSSPHGTHVAQVCDGKLVVTTLATGRSSTHELPVADVAELVVDDEGTVTATYDRSVVRVTATAVEGPFTLDVPRDAVVSGSAELRPAIGPWLAYSDGAFSKEVAWRSGGAAPAAVPLHGGALFNGDQMWVSLMASGYVKMTATGPVPVRGDVRGGLPGYGVLLDDKPWGPDGLLAHYEQAVLLLDHELVPVCSLLTPNGKGQSGRLGSDPTGTRLYYAAVDGSISIATP